MQKQPNPCCKHLNDSLLSAFKSSSQSLKQSAGKNLYETHNKLMNKILLVSEKDLDQTIREILAHFLNVAQVKNSIAIVIGLLTKFIEFFKFYERHLSHKYNKSISTQSLNSPKLSSKGFTKQQETVIQQNSQLNPASNPLKKPSSHQLPSLEPLLQPNPQQTISQMLTQIIDIILLLQNKSKSTDTESYLRIIQTTFSLIDAHFIQYMSYNVLTKIFSISFQCCLSNVVIQNISVSCLFSLIQTLFGIPKKYHQGNLILQNFLEFLFRNKKFSWIKEGDLNGIIWDLSIAAIKHQSFSSIQHFILKESNIHLINIMYKISAQKAFVAKLPINTKPQKNQQKKNSQQVSLTFKHDPTSQFIRCYKAFVILSIQYSLTFLQEGTRSCSQDKKSSTNRSDVNQPVKQQVVPFRDNLRLFGVIYDLQRNWRMYILIEGIFLIVEKYPEFTVNEQKGYILLQIISKVAQELCLSNHKISCQWAHQKSFLNKFYAGDLNTINDGDFVKIIRNSLINLRKKFEYMKSKENEFWSNNTKSQFQKSTISARQNISSQRSQPSSSKNSQDQSTYRKRWQKFIKCIIKIIRYISSISILSQTDEQPVRKIILELQHWFLICPSSKIKNMILQQLLITTSTLTTKQQAIKISQCIQIGSNLIYGYYDMLDSIGLTIVMKMMAGIKAAKEQGKEFQELEQVFNMSQKLYLEQKIVKTQKQFSTTIQAFVQCANSLLADLQQPPSSTKSPQPGKHPSHRYYKMIQYILEKLNIVILQSPPYLFEEWNFLTGFWMSFCSNKNQQIQARTIVFVGSVVQKLLQIFRQRQEQVIGIYLQLSAKLTQRKDLKIQMQIIGQIKNYIPLLQNQKALMETFNIIEVLQSEINNFYIAASENKSKSLGSQALVDHKKFLLQLSELQQAFVKQGIWRIKSLQNLSHVVEGIQVLGNQKNQQYKILTLLWNVADHLRNLSAEYIKQNQITSKEAQTQKPSKQSQDQSNTPITYQSLWKKVFLKIQKISSSSLNTQTKQSSIHTFTQIIAQSSPVIKDSLLIEIYEQIFIENLFMNLIENCTTFHDKNIDVSHRVDMVKAAVKNYFKLTKKFVLENIFKQPRKNVDFTVEKIVRYLKQLDKTQPTQIMPVQVMFEFLVLVQKLINPENIETKFVNFDQVTQIFKQLESISQKSDQTTILFRKKYTPHLTEIKEKFNKLNQKPSNQTKQELKSENPKV